ncbi:hypothetical protein [Actinoplanes flavus]|uniref:Uncharacterized protein n=1 Tax=Actinoplanes flavus TaxID=2820290 RepID=A0ABS3UVR1_9ACTN|nr:hypothetical protein [Actinoplanes flavus]MBO3742666.1 hypothetical protein [Actinoplanes flavus]
MCSTTPPAQSATLTKEEDAEFWEWAYVEVLRHTGIRVEELVELTIGACASTNAPTVK